MTGRRRRIPSFVFDEGGLREFEYLEDALDAAGGELSEDMRAILDEHCTVLFIDRQGEMPDEFAGQYPHTPPAHRPAVAASAMAMLQTFSSRNPVLIVDAGEQFLMAVVPGQRLEKYIKRRYGQKVPLATPPPDKMERWVVSIAQDQELLRIAVGIGPRPDIGRA